MSDRKPLTDAVVESEAVDLEKRRHILSARVARDLQDARRLVRECAESLIDDPVILARVRETIRRWADD